MATPSTANTSQHYVPQMLLRGFATESDAEQVWVFDKRSQRSFLTAIRNIAAERGYYDLDRSADLDAEMNRADGIASPIISEIRRRRSLSGISNGARAELAGFVAFQMLRTRGTQENMLHMQQSLIAVVTERAGGVAPDLGLDLSPAQAREGYLRTIPNLAPSFVPHLLDKDLLLFRTGSNFPFCISDHPVALNNTINRGDGITGTLGLAVRGIEIYLPIGAELTLCYMCPTIGQRYELILNHERALGGFVNQAAYEYLRSGDTGMALRLGSEQVRFQNSLQIINSERFLISSVNEFTDAIGMVEAYPDARFGRRATVR